MKNLITILVAATTLQTSCYAGPTQKDEPLSVKMTHSEMVRNPKAWMIDFAKVPKWNYCNGLLTGAMLRCYDKYGDPAIVEYVKQFAEEMITPDGVILTYRMREYSLDRINSGKVLYRLLDMTGDSRYKVAIDSLRKQLDTQPRTSDGGFWHKKIYPSQMWLDGLYMAAPFYAEYAKRYGTATDFDDVIDQFATAYRHTLDPATGLLRHAWDESRQMAWADPKTGQSPHVWGRALGWYMMALVDVLDFVPADHPRRGELIAILQSLSQALLKYQNPITGAWYQVVDMPEREGNYQETSCTAMFGYAMAKGVRGKYLDTQYLDVARKAYNGLLENFVVENADGTISLTRVCGVAGLGGKPYRDGSFEYYINEIIRDNDPKGVAPLILLSLEFE